MQKHIIVTETQIAIVRVMCAENGVQIVFPPQQYKHQPRSLHKRTHVRLVKTSSVQHQDQIVTCMLTIGWRVQELLGHSSQRQLRSIGQTMLMNIALGLYPGSKVESMRACVCVCVCVCVYEYVCVKDWS